MKVVACLKTTRNCSFLKARSIVERWDDGALVPQEDIGLVTICENLICNVDGYPVYFIRGK